MLNPYTIIAALVLAAALFFGGEHVGNTRGTNAQKVADHVQFDKINKQTAENKAIADAKYRGAQAIIIQLAADRALADNQREKERQSDVKTINDLHNRYASVGLRFSTGQTSGLGGSGIRADSTGASTAGNNGSTDVQLPDALSRDLRSLQFEADRLRIDYALLFKWAHDPNLCPK